MKTKDEIRAEMRARRRALPDGARAAASAAVCARLLARDDVRAVCAARRPVAVYLATRDELDLTAFIAALWRRGVPVAVPCWLPQAGAYGLGAYDASTRLVAGAFRIREPAAPQPVAPEDVAAWIVPGLAFTRAGGRIGYGGGWFDRLLLQAAPTAVTLGVAHAFQIVDALPAEAHDRVLTAVVDAGE